MATTTKTGTPVFNTAEEATVRIQLQLLDGDADNVDQSVPVTVNGKTLIIQRGQVVDLPVPYYIVLKQSGKYGL